MMMVMKVFFTDPVTVLVNGGGCAVKSSHLYLYSAFNNTNCNKALHNIKIGKMCQ